MRLLNQYNIWPIARLNNYKYGVLFTAIIIIFSILGFLYLNGDKLHVSSKIIVAVSQNDSDKSINDIIKIFESNGIKNDYKIIPEAEISALLVGLNNTASISKYLENKNNYNFPVFIEFNYGIYYKYNIDNLLKDLTFNKYTIDNGISIINIFIYFIYFILLLVVLSLYNISSLRLDKRSIQIMNYYGASKNLLIRIIYRRIGFNTVIGFILGWLIIFMLLNILNLKNTISLNTIHFINLNNISSFFYFFFILTIVLYTQYVVILKVLKRFMKTKIE